MKTLLQWNTALNRGMLWVLLVAMPGGRLAAGGWVQEEALDRRLGLLDRPWNITYHPSRTRFYFQERARVTTGLPPYDQQVERAGQSPAALYERLTAPTPRAPARDASKTSYPTPMDLPEIETPPATPPDPGYDYPDPDNDYPHGDIP